MRLDEVMAAISEVEIMGGTVGEMLAPSEVRAIAEAVLAGGVALMAGGDQASAMPAWMMSIPHHMRDCFSA